MVAMAEVTRFEMQEFGLSNYLIYQLTRGLTYRWDWGCRVYPACDIEAAIAKKLAQPRTMAKTRTVLGNFRLRLRGQSNVVAMNFLPQLSLAEEMRLLEAQLRVAEANHEVVARETDKLLAQVRRVVKKNRSQQRDCSESRV
ncbi:MAG: hypothetical protein AAGG51_21310 [Cyanobacteria bacterium P01_G01_bin.54]